MRAVIYERYPRDRLDPLEHVIDASKYVGTEQTTGNVVLAVS